MTLLSSSAWSHHTMCKAVYSPAVALQMIWIGVILIVSLSYIRKRSANGRWRSDLLSVWKNVGRTCECDQSRHKNIDPVRYPRICSVAI